VGRIESNAQYVIGSQNTGGKSRLRERNDMDSGDVMAVLTGAGDRGRVITGHRNGETAAGKLSRKTNDESVPLLLDDADTDIEKKFAARNWSGKNVAATLDGLGYIEHDERVKPATKKGGLIDERTMMDSVGALNLLKPDENPEELRDPTLWMDAKTDYELYLYNKNFGNGAPYGTDPLDSWYGKPDYTSAKMFTEDDMEIRLEAAYHKAANFIAPEETEPGQRRGVFQLADKKAEYEAGRNQQRKAHGIAKEVPFGVFTTPVNYETSSSSGLAGGLEAWGARWTRRRWRAASRGGGWSARRRRTPAETSGQQPSSLRDRPGERIGGRAC